LTDLLEKFKPQTVSDIVGNDNAIQRVISCIKVRKPCIICGETGIGKTSSVYAIANDLNYKVVEKNASDERNEDEMKNFLRQLQSKNFIPTIFLIDEVDNLNDFTMIEKCLQESKNPLVLIVKDYYKLPYKIRNLAEQIKYYNPQIGHVVSVINKIAKATGRKADYSQVSTDVRNSILRAFYSGEKCKSQTDKEIVEDYFSKKMIDNLNEDHFIWLIDNAEDNYRGRSLYTFFKLLSVADQTQRFDSLKAVKRGKSSVIYPRYLQRVNVLRGGKAHK
jgi:DNA polymerase III delta prime subunit